jgi:hypothetical protein
VFFSFLDVIAVVKNSMQDRIILIDEVPKNILMQKEHQFIFKAIINYHREKTRSSKPKEKHP